MADAAVSAECCSGEFFHANDCPMKDPTVLAQRKGSRTETKEQRAACRAAKQVVWLEQRAASRALLRVVPVEAVEQQKQAARTPMPSVPLAVTAVLVDWGRRYGVTPAECEILSLATCGYDHAAIASQRGTAPSTVKNQVLDMLRKVRRASLAAAAVQILSEALAATAVRCDTNVE